MTERARGWVLLAALLGALSSGATTVFLVGSHNRRIDRQEILRYEAGVTADVREMNVVAGSMLNLVDGLSGGTFDPAVIVKRLGEFRSTFDGAASRLALVPAPVALGRGSPTFVPAATAYGEAARLIAAGVPCMRRGPPPTGDEDCLAFRQGNEGAERALVLYRRAVRALQATRLRLGLGPSPNFGDPPR